LVQPATHSSPKAEKLSPRITKNFNRIRLPLFTDGE
jgi:hypothetical protein